MEGKEIQNKEIKGWISYIDDITGADSNKNGECARTMKILVKNDAVDITKLSGYKKQFIYTSRVFNNFDETKAYVKENNTSKMQVEENVEDTIKRLEKSGVIKKLT